MRRILGTAIAAAALALLALAGAAPAATLLNPSFEAPSGSTCASPSAWLLGGWIAADASNSLAACTATDSTAVEGDGSLTVTVPANSTTPTLSQDIGVVPQTGESYTFSVWLQAPANTAGNATVQIVPTSSDASGGVTTGAAASSIVTFAAAATPSWVPAQVTWSLPAGAAQSYTGMRVQVIFAGAGAWKVDAADIQRTFIANASFADGDACSLASPTPVNGWTATGQTCVGTPTSPIDGPTAARWTASAAASLVQDVPVSARSGQSWSAALWVRADAGTPQVTMKLEALDVYNKVVQAGAVTTRTVAATGWTRVEASANFDIASSAAPVRAIRIRLTAPTSAAATLWVDGATMTQSLLGDASFDQGPATSCVAPNASYWSATGTSSFCEKNVSAVAAVGGGYAELTASGASVVQTGARTRHVRRNEVVRFSAWVQASAGRNGSIKIVAEDANGATVGQTAEKTFVYTAGWTRVSTTIKVAGDGWARLRGEIRATNAQAGDIIRVDQTWLGTVGIDTPPLGVEHTSVSVASMPLGLGATSMVMAGSGNHVVRWTPMSSPGRGPDTVVGLTYNSEEGTDPDSVAGSALGRNWSLSISSLARIGSKLRFSRAALQADGSTADTGDWVEFTDADGSVHRFVWIRTNSGTTAPSAAHGYWWEQAGDHLYLRFSTSTSSAARWLISRTDNSTFEFDLNGTLIALVDVWANKLRFDYAGTTLTVTDATGRTYVVTYSATIGTAGAHVISIANHSATAVPGTGNTLTPGLTLLFGYAASATQCLTSIAQKTGPSSSIPLLTFSYDATATTTCRLLGVADARAGDTPAYATIFKYDAAPRSERIVGRIPRNAGMTTWPATSPASAESFSYTGNETLTTLPTPAETEGDGSRGGTFRVDERNLLVETNSKFRFADQTGRLYVGPRTTVTYSDARDAEGVTQWGEPDDLTTTYAYDANGQLTSRVDPPNGYADPRYYTTVLRYDQLSITDASNAYDGTGLPAASEVPADTNQHFSRLVESKTPRQGLLTGNGAVDPAAEGTRLIYSSAVMGARVPVQMSTPLTDDGAGHVTSRGRTWITYDSYGEPTHVRTRQTIDPTCLDGAGHEAERWRLRINVYDESGLVRLQRRGYAAVAPPADPTASVMAEPSLATVSATATNRCATMLLAGTGANAQSADASGIVSVYGADGALAWSMTATQDSNNGDYNETYAANPATDMRTVVTADAWGRPTRVSVPKTHTAIAGGTRLLTDTVYDANGNVVGVHRAVEAIDKPPPQATISTTNATGYSENGTGGGTEPSSGSGWTSRVDYDNQDHPIRTADASGGLVKRRWDEAGRLMAVSRPRRQDVSSAEWVTPTYTASSARRADTTFTLYDAQDRAVHIASFGDNGTDRRDSWTCYDAAMTKAGNGRDGDVRSTTPTRRDYDTGGCALKTGPSDTGSPVSPFATTYQTDQWHRVVSAIDPTGVQTVSAYTLDGDPGSTKVEDSSGTVVSYHVETYSLGRRKIEAKDRVDGTTGPSNGWAVHGWDYDIGGNVVVDWNPRSMDVLNTHSGTSASDALARATKLTYDAYDRVTVEQLGYSPGSSSDPTPSWIIHNYTLDDQTDWVSRPLRQASQPTGVTAANFTKFYYFDNGWISSRNDPGSNTRLRSYDYTPEGWQTDTWLDSVTDSHEQTLYTAAGRIKQQIGRTTVGGTAPSISTAYDLDGNVVSADRSDSSSSLTSTFNGWDEPLVVDLHYPTSIPRQSGGADRTWARTTYTYGTDATAGDVDAMLTARKDGQELDASLVSKLGARVQTFGYDNAGRLTSSQDAGNAVSTYKAERATYTYDGIGRLTRTLVEQQTGATSWPDVLTVDTTYADNGVVTSSTTRRGSPTSPIIEQHVLGYYSHPSSYTVYADGSPATDDITLATGSGICLVVCHATYSYSAADKLTSYVDGEANGFSASWRFGNTGELTGEVTTNGNFVKTTTTAWDGSAPTSQAYDVGDASQNYTQYNHYDAYGSLDCAADVRITDCTSAGHYTTDSRLTNDGYDSFGKLVTHYAYTYDASGTNTEIQHSGRGYDPLQRAQREVRNWTEASGPRNQSRSIVYAGTSGFVTDEVIGTDMGYQMLQARYSVARTPSGAAVSMDSQSAETGTTVTTKQMAYGYDPHGDVTALLDTSGVEQAYGYRPYGDDFLGANAGSYDVQDQNPMNPVRFNAGRPTDLGGLDLGFRNYNQNSHVFQTADYFNGAYADSSLATDPLTGWRYAYAGNNPAGYSEWDGHHALSDADSGSGQVHPSEDLATTAGRAWAQWMEEHGTNEHQGSVTDAAAGAGDAVVGFLTSAANGMSAGLLRRVAPGFVSAPVSTALGWGGVHVDKQSAGYGVGSMGTLLATLVFAAPETSAAAGTADTAAIIDETVAPEVTAVPEATAGGAATAGGGASRAVDDVLEGLARGRQPNVRTVGSDDELRSVYDELAQGGSPVDVPGYPGKWVERPDGVRIGIREESKTGGATIDIRHPDGSVQRVHIG